VLLSTGNSFFTLTLFSLFGSQHHVRPLAVTNTFHTLFNNYSLWIHSVYFCLSPHHVNTEYRNMKNQVINHKSTTWAGIQKSSTHLGRNDIVSNVPDTCAIYSTWDCDIQLSAVGHCNAFHFSSRGANDLVKLLVSFIPPDDIAVDTSLQIYKHQSNATYISNNINIDSLVTIVDKYMHFKIFRCHLAAYCTFQYCWFVHVHKIYS